MHGGVKWRLDKCSSALPLDWTCRSYKYTCYGMLSHWLCLRASLKQHDTVCLGIPIAPLLFGVWEAQQRTQNNMSYLFQPRNSLLVAFELALWF